MEEFKHTLKSGKYLICDPVLYFKPQDYRRLDKNLATFEKYSQSHLSWGISCCQYAWFNTGKGEFTDQYGNIYKTDRLLVCAPLDMLDIDPSLVECIEFSEDFELSMDDSIHVGNFIIQL